MDYIKNLDGEIWCDIEGYPKYQISNKGRVKSLKRPNARLLTAFTNNCGYERVALTNAEGQSKRVLVSRLVAIAFCEKPNEDSDTVDHIDTNKTNNNAENLRWMTSAENTRTYFQRRKNESDIYCETGSVSDFYDCVGGTVCVYGEDGSESIFYVDSEKYKVLNKENE